MGTYIPTTGVQSGRAKCKAGACVLGLGSAHRASGSQSQLMHPVAYLHRSQVMCTWDARGGLAKSLLPTHPSGRRHLSEPSREHIKSQPHSPATLTGGFSLEGRAGIRSTSQGGGGLTDLWLLAVMVFTLSGSQMTTSASEPTATRPFLGYKLKILAALVLVTATNWVSSILPVA